jgi:hypothetical protein
MFVDHVLLLILIVVPVLVLIVVGINFSIIFDFLIYHKSEIIFSKFLFFISFSMLVLPKYGFLTV